jgi:murein L,D-transpeptidase YcbB/YkuD
MHKLASAYLLIGLGFAACSNGLSSSGKSESHVSGAQSQLAGDSLSPAGQRNLRAVVDSGSLSDLQWPKFANRSDSVKEFYEETGYQLGWIREGKPTPQALELIGIPQEADQKGLESKDYDGLRWTEHLQELQSGDGDAESRRLKFDVALTVSGTRYISDLHFGRVDPATLHKDFDPERHRHNPGEFLREEVVGAQSVRDALAKIECQYPGYQRELAAFQQYLQMAKEEVPVKLPPVQKPINPGQTYEGLGQLVERLQFLRDRPASKSVPADSQNYSGAVGDGVKRFQARHALEPSGKFGPQTIAELNRPMSDRGERLRLSLERWRWLPHDLAEPAIFVNIPEFKLRAGDATSGKPDLVMRVVVGKAMRTETPVLEEDMKYMVFWPYWNVPSSILRGEMIPKIGKDRTYVERNNYEVATYSGQMVTDSVVSDEILAQLRAGKLTMRQKPGPKNALGLSKFIFPNDNNVYLQSTPAQTLFSKQRRDFSHGCIRVQDPQGLAKWVLRNNPGWSKDCAAAAFKTEKEQQVDLTRIVPVLILYASAVAEEDGWVYFLEDIYGHGKSLVSLEAQAYTAHQ